jgi:hypothetical protein
LALAGGARPGPTQIEHIADIDLPAWRAGRCGQRAGPAADPGDDKAPRHDLVLGRGRRRELDAYLTRKAAQQRVELSEDMAHRTSRKRALPAWRKIAAGRKADAVAHDAETSRSGNS